MTDSKDIFEQLKSIKENMLHNGLSACIIYKEEDYDYLHDCLQSIPNNTEIILCKTIGTEKIYEPFNSEKKVIFGREVNYTEFQYYKKSDCKPYDFVNNHFSYSEARNYCMQFATQDWILSLDADERIMISSNEIDFRNINPKIGGILVSVHSQDFRSPIISNWEETCASRYTVPQYRIFRRGLNFHNRSHEYIFDEILKAGYQCVDSTVIIKHIGYGKSEDDITDKTLKNLAMMSTDIKRDLNNKYILNRYIAALRYLSARKMFEVENMQLLDVKSIAENYGSHGIKFIFDANQLTDNIKVQAFILEADPLNKQALKNQFTNISLLWRIGYFHDKI